MSTDTKTRVAVVGGGPGGYAAAFLAADLGLDVTLIDVEENPGGVCLYRGCIPSKALLHVAKLLQEAREASYWGIDFGEPKVDLARMRDSTSGVINKMVGGLGQLAKARNVRFIHGRADFLDSRTLHVLDVRGKDHEVETDYTILATGSRPATLPNFAIDSPRVMNSTDALKLEEVPDTLLVIGGGYIGLELGMVYAALGAKVTVVEMMGQLLPGADTDMVKVLHERVEAVMHKVHLNTKVLSMDEKKDGMHVSFEGPEIKKGKQRFDKVLVCIGRKPNSSGIGLSNTQVEVDDKGFVIVDEQRRTTDPRIFAIGDVAGEPMLAHKASHEGRVAAEVIAGKRVAFEPLSIPAVVFTDPEVAWAGVTENQAKEQKLDFEVARFPWGASGRAATLNRSDGITKIITEKGTGRIIGVGIVGPGAGELIAEGALAIEMGATATDLSLTIHPHPTLGETIMESAEMIFGSSTHVYRPRKA